MTRPRASATATGGGGFARLALILCLAAGASSCAMPPPRAPGVGEPLDWRRVDGWRQDRHAEAWPALLRGCAVMAMKPHWENLCRAARTHPDPDNERARRFFERWFTPHALHARDGRADGLITGYYEPLLDGSFTPDDRYRYPLYARPETLLTVELGDLYPELGGKGLRGRLVGRKVLPFYSRREIDSEPSPLAGSELLWIDDRDAAFFLHVQGSGRVRLPDGRVVGVGYADQNGHPYLAIGKLLLERNQLKREEISLFSIRRWLRDHPRRAGELLFHNPRYVFFALREDSGDGPVGALNVPLTPERSIAVDPDVVDLGVPVWLSTNFPADPERPYRRLVFAQDTGAAIRGALRADLFWGHGERAERAAGIMQEPGRLIVLLPKAAGDGE